MVALSAVQASNNLIASTLPARLVGVFVGSTSGIGESTLKQFAKHTKEPRAYIVGRSQSSADRIIAECRTLNPSGEYIFIQSDISLIRNVDVVCREIMSKEKAINILFCTQGTLDPKTDTSEQLRLKIALIYHSRFRFLLNLLPLLQQATALRRVVFVFYGGAEGKIVTNDFQGQQLSMIPWRDHVATLKTLSLEAVAKSAPNVSFVHDSPGLVYTNGFASVKGILGVMVRVLIHIFQSFICVPIVESGERHLFFATSARYAPAQSSGEGAEGAGVPLANVGDVATAKGTDGKIGSGVYSVDQNGETSGPEAEQTLAEYRRTGMLDKVWENTLNDFKRITGSEKM